MTAFRCLIWWSSQIMNTSRKKKNKKLQSICLPRLKRRRCFCKKKWKETPFWSVCRANILLHSPGETLPQFGNVFYYLKRLSTLLFVGLFFPWLCVIMTRLLFFLHSLFLLLPQYYFRFSHWDEAQFGILFETLSSCVNPILLLTSNSHENMSSIYCALYFSHNLPPSLVLCLSSFSFFDFSIKVTKIYLFLFGFLYKPPLSSASVCVFYFRCCFLQFSFHIQ